MTVNGDQTGRTGPGRGTRRRVVQRVAGSAAGIGGIVAAACGMGTGTGGDGAAPAASGASGQITFMSRDNGSDLEPYKQGIERFNAAQGKVRVTHEIATGSYFPKLQTMLVAGTPPDVTYMHSANAASFAPEGSLAELDTLVRRDKGALDGLLPNAVEAYRFRGATYGVPDVTTSLVMFVNRSLFARTGATLPTDRWTWSDFLAAAQRVTNAGRAEEVWGTADYTGNFPRYTVLWQNDADILNKDRNAVTVDAPATVEALTWLADQLHRLRVHPTPAEMAGKTALQLFQEGKVAMWPNISSSMGTVAKTAAFDFEVFHLPQGKKRVTRTACGDTAMVKASKNPEAGWAFEKFLATEEFQWLMVKAAGIIFPAHKKVTEAPELFAGGPFPKSPKISVEAMAYARTEPYVPLYDDLVAAYNKELAPVWAGETTVRDAVTKAKATMDPIVKDAVARMK